MPGTWREVARPIISRVLRETADKPPAEVRKALRDAYPFGPRKYWPYTVWCDEVRLQLGLRRATRRHHRPGMPPERERALYDAIMRGEA